MVHALEEVGRVLVPSGIMIDLRPLAGGWPVQVVEANRVHAIGQITDLPQGLEDDAAANRTMAEAGSKGWFIREREEFFELNYYWDSPREFEEHLSDQWSDFASIEDPVRESMRSAWALAGPEARIRVPARMQIARWKKAA